MRPEMMEKVINTVPYISVLVVCRNEEEYIKLSLQSVLNQDYPDDRYEILVIDGMSDDGTVNVAKQVIDRYETEHDGCPDTYFLPNEKKILAAGWNIGIRNSKGSYVVRIDAHSEIPSDYISKCVATITMHDAVCVGGKIESKSMQREDDTIAKVLSSPFGVGNSSFRVSNTEGYVDTAVYGLYDRRIFDKVGYFDESLVRNQDIELHARIRNAGGKFYFNPVIKSTYYTRNTVKKMLRQAFQNGKWNPIVSKKTKGTLSIRHMIPFAFVSFTGICTILGCLKRGFWYLELMILGLHLCLGFVFAKKKTSDPKELAKMPFLFMALHLTYGTGFLTGLFHKSYGGRKK